MARHDIHYGNDSNQKVAKRIPIKQQFVHGYKERQKVSPYNLLLLTHRSK